MLNSLMAGGELFLTSDPGADFSYTRLMHSAIKMAVEAAYPTVDLAGILQFGDPISMYFLPDN